MNFNTVGGFGFEERSQAIEFEILTNWITLSRKEVTLIETERKED